MSQLVFAAALAAFTSTAASAAGIDRDMMLSEAPATPDKGTVRITGSGLGQSQTESGGTNQSSVAGSIMWAPFQNFAGDVGIFYQGQESGPAARVRYQFLNQASMGLDMAAGLRFKTNSFHHRTGGEHNGEVEFLLLAGRTFGPVELVLNGVFGMETGGANGKDIEVKAFAGWRFSDQLKAGLDGRLQADIEEEGAAPKPPNAPRDFDLSAGPAISWSITRQLNLQALVGVFMPKQTTITSPGGVLQASFDF